MMEEQMQKRISDAITDGTSSLADELKQALAEDLEAEAYSQDLITLEKQLRLWGFEQPPRQYWKSFPGRLTPRLGASISDSEEDLLAPPAPDETQEVTSSSMVSDARKPIDQEGGLSALAALARRSANPLASNFGENGVAVKQEDDAIIDLGAIKAEAAEKEKKKAEEKKRTATAPAEEKPQTEAVPTPSKAVAAPERKQQGSTAYVVVGLFVIVLFVGGYFAFGTTASMSEADQSAVAVSPSPQTSAAHESISEEESSSAEVSEALENPEPPSEPEPVAEVDESTESESASSVTSESREAAQTRHARRGPARGRKAQTSAVTPPPVAIAPEQPAAASAAEASGQLAKAAPTPPTKAGGASNLDDLLAGATRSVKATQTPSGKAGGSADDAVRAAVGQEQAAASALPEQPSRSQVRRAMGSVAGQVMACRSLVQAQVRVNATVTVANSGSVTNAAISGGSPEVQQCVDRAVRRAHFPRFSRPSFTVTYPFVLSPPE